MIKQNTSQKIELRTKKPKFIRQDYHQKRFKSKWRRPKGLHSKLRLSKKGHNKRPKIGYGSPKNLKGLNKNNLKEILIKNLKDIKNIDAKINAVIISSTLGLRKKLDVISKCKEKGFTIINIKDIEKFVSDVNKDIEIKKQEKRKKETKKKKSKEEALKKAQERKQKKEGTEEKKDRSKEDKKILTEEIKQPKQALEQEVKQKTQPTRTQIFTGSKK